MIHIERRDFLVSVGTFPVANVNRIADVPHASPDRYARIKHERIEMSDVLWHGQRHTVFPSYIAHHECVVGERRRECEIISVVQRESLSCVVGCLGLQPWVVCLYRHV